MGGDDWDLQAVVRSCRASPPAAAAERDPFSLLLPFSSPEAPASGAEIFSSGGAAVHVPELEELYRPFFPKSQMQQPQPKQPSQSLLLPHFPPAAPSPQLPRRPAMSHRSKKRKNQPKRVVCHVPADAASADLWAWRKYGQKPIKGSPYPRGYYRCSSSKGCPARKQVERSRTDPGTLLITYSAEHNHPVPTHRNSLAGSTRSKFPTSATPPPAAASSPASSGLSPTTTLAASTEEDEDDDGVLLVEDMEVAGEDELLFMGGTGTGTGSAAVTSSFFDDDGWFEEHFSASPWMNGTPAAAAAGGR